LKIGAKLFPIKKSAAAQGVTAFFYKEIHDISVRRKTADSGER
jgi:hypothetical protein